MENKFKPNDIPNTNCEEEECSKEYDLLLLKLNDIKKTITLLENNFLYK